MTVATREARLALAVCSPHVFGEDVVLPAGTVRGVIDMPGLPVESRARGTQTGSVLGIDHQQPPTIWLRTADAVGLKEKDSISARGETWLVVSLIPDGAGMTEVLCMRPGAEPGPHPEYRVWR
jgi:hypothetical protein